MDDFTHQPTDEQPAEDKPSGRHLSRSRSTRIIGGVCGGVAKRFDVDVNLVRVGFIVLAFLWGVGIIAYLALWVLLPRSEDDGVASEPTTLRAMTRSSSILLVAVLVVLIVVVTNRHHFAGPGSAIAVLWIALLAALAFLAIRSPGGRGVGRILSRFLFGLVSLGAVLVVAVVIYVVSSGVPLRGGTGERLWQPTSLAQTEHRYALAVGRSVIDLSAVSFPKRGYDVTASVGVGMLEVVVPDRVVVDLRTHVGIGAVSFPTVGYSNGGFVEVPVGVDPRTARHLILDAQVGIGQLVVERANAFEGY
ncbi:MAG TPA: PspC domain-containing protein [Acidimicrobiales bacterium]|nr:PspC domain-containing protein [Acidimicrobiales bacterium]